VANTQLSQDRACTDELAVFCAWALHCGDVLQSNITFCDICCCFSSSSLLLSSLKMLKTVKFFYINLFKMHFKSPHIVSYRNWYSRLAACVVRRSILSVICSTTKAVFDAKTYIRCTSLPCNVSLKAINYFFHTLQKPTISITLLHKACSNFLWETWHPYYEQSSRSRGLNETVAQSMPVQLLSQHIGIIADCSAVSCKPVSVTCQPAD